MSICVNRLQELTRSYRNSEIGASAYVEEVFRVLGEARNERLSSGEVRFIRDLLDRIEDRELAPVDAIRQARALFPLPRSPVPTVEEFSSSHGGHEDDGYDGDDDDDEDEDGLDDGEAPSRSDSIRWGKLLAMALVFGVLCGVIGGGTLLLLPHLSEKREISRQQAVQEATALALEGLTAAQAQLADQGRGTDIDAVVIAMGERATMVTDEGWTVQAMADAFNGRVLLRITKGDREERINLFLCEGRFRLEDCYESL